MLVVFFVVWVLLVLCFVMFESFLSDVLVFLREEVWEEVFLVRDWLEVVICVVVVVVWVVFLESFVLMWLMVMERWWVMI